MSEQEKLEFSKRLSSLAGTDDQNVLAKKWDIAQSMVSSCLNGNKMPSMHKACYIAKVENVCVEWLMTGRGPKYPQSADKELSAGEIQLLKYWNFMDEPNRKDWLSIGSKLVSEPHREQAKKEFKGLVIMLDNGNEEVVVRNKSNIND